MRLAAIASALAIVICAAIFGAIFFQKTSGSGPAPLPAQAASAEGQAPAVTRNVSSAGPKVAAAVAQVSPTPPLAWPMVASSCSNPNALGVSRVVEIDTTGCPGFGF